MRSIRFIALTLVALLALGSCKGNPEVAKKRYVESGDKYFNKGRYKEATIQYRNAIRIDPKYGLAYYKLALTDLKLPQPDGLGAVNALRRVEQLMNRDQPEFWDAMVKLTELYLAGGRKDAQLMKEAGKNCDELLARDANSFDGHRLKGDWKYVAAIAELEVKRTEEGRKDLDEALTEYRKADSIKPGDQGVTLQIAEVLVVKGDYSTAERFYRQVIDQKKDFLLGYRKLYAVLRIQNKRADAEQLLKAGYQNNPKQYGFLTWLAEQYLTEGRKGDMLNVLAQLKSKVGEYPRAYLEAGDFYLRVGDPESAVREYQDGMVKDAKNRGTYQKRIVEVRARQGKMADAADVNDQILKENPKDADALGVKATLLLDKGEVTQALTGLQQAVTRAPDNPVAHYNLGRAYVLHSDIEQARQQFQKAIELRPDYLPARFATAQLQVARGEFEAAMGTAEEILKYDRNSVSARLIQSAALMGQKKFDDARKILDALEKANPSAPDVLFQIGVLNLADHKYKEAEEGFRRSYELNPANTRGLMGVVETLMAQNKTDQAIQVLQAEAAKTPNRTDLHVALGNIGVRSGRWDMAVSEFQTVLSHAAKGSRLQGEMYLRIGETQRRKGDLNAAIVSFQAARQTLPEDERVLGTLALTLDGANRWDEAKKVYQATYKLYPNDAISLNNLAFGMAEHGDDLDQALSLAQRAKQLLSTMPEVSDTLGWIYLKKGLADNAIEIFQNLVTSHPKQSTFRYHLGMALSLKGDKVRAVQELKKALEGGPSDPERKKIQELITRLG
jgi:tetratricopeptide (TPR) repeat protein